VDDLFELHGTDVNPEHVAWCREHLSPITFTTNEPLPPLPHAAASLDGVWALSVFTHLDKESGTAWRAELARVLAPNGVLIATTHGEPALSKLLADPAWAASIGLAADAVRGLDRDLRGEGMAFVPYSMAAALSRRREPVSATGSRWCRPNTSPVTGLTNTGGSLSTCRVVCVAGRTSSSCAGDNV
jgi:SAM-dependent methyltransferase